MKKEEIVKQLSETFGYRFEVGCDTGCNDWSMLSFYGHIQNTNKTKYVTVSVTEIEDFKPIPLCGI